MQKNNGKTNAARVRDLEKAANSSTDNNEPAVIVDWDDTPESELEPGTLVIEWGPNDQIISHRVKGAPKNARRNHKTN